MPRFMQKYSPDPMFVAYLQYEQLGLISLLNIISGTPYHVMVS